MNKDTLEKYLSLDYPLKVYKSHEYDDQAEVYVAEFLDLPGCIAYGDTVEEAYQAAQEAKREWLRVTISQGLPVPKPSRTEDHSGRILLRLPSALHGMLADQAKLAGVSLNQYLVHLLSSGAVGDSIAQDLSELRSEVAELRQQVARVVLNTSQIAASVRPPRVFLTTSPHKAYGVGRQIVVGNPAGEEETTESFQDMFLQSYILANQSR